MDESFKVKKSWFKEHYLEVKESIFQVIHFTLKYDSISLFTIFVINIVELFQLMTFPFHQLVLMLKLVLRILAIFEYREYSK